MEQSTEAISIAIIDTAMENVSMEMVISMKVDGSMVSGMDMGY